jgi:hypothetical protein
VKISDLGYIISGPLKDFEVNASRLQPSNREL